MRFNVNIYVKECFFGHFGADDNVIATTPFISDRVSSGSTKSGFKSEIRIIQPSKVVVSRPLLSTLLKGFLLSTSKMRNPYNARGTVAET